MHPGRGRAGEPAEQLVEPALEVLGVVLVPAQCAAHTVREADGAAEPHVDPSGEQGREDAELFRDDQRAVVGEHDPAGAHPDRAGGRRHGRGQHGGRGTGHPGHPVMFRHPEAVEAETLRVPGQSHGVAQGLGGAVALADAGAVEDGEAGGGEYGGHTGFNVLGVRGFPRLTRRAAPGRIRTRLGGAGVVPRCYLRPMVTPFVVEAVRLS